MKNGYDQFFKSARQAAQGESPSPKKSAQFSIGEKPRFQITADQMEQQLKRRAGIKARKKKKSFPIMSVLLLVLGLGGAGWCFINSEQVEKVAKTIEISWLGNASAAEAAPAKKPAAPAAGAEGAKAATPASEAAAANENKESGSTEPDHLSKLNERQKEIEAREEELTRQEAELAHMKTEMETRLKDLEEMRAKISEILADRVKIDDQKVETLVQMYSNMKPPQAAKVFESMDEDLAVQILSRMKKKNAADVMNLLPSAKAQVFSEKYAGYKRSPAGAK